MGLENTLEQILNILLNILNLLGLIFCFRLGLIFSFQPGLIFFFQPGLIFLSDWCGIALQGLVTQVVFSCTPGDLELGAL